MKRCLMVSVLGVLSCTASTYGSSMATVPSVIGDGMEGNKAIIACVRQEGSIIKAEDEAFVQDFMANQEPKDIQEVLKILVGIKGSEKKTAKLLGFESATPVRNILEGNLKGAVDRVGGSPHVISGRLKKFSDIQKGLKLTDGEFLMFSVGLRGVFEKARKDKESERVSEGVIVQAPRSAQLCRELGTAESSEVMPASIAMWDGEVSQPVLEMEDEMFLQEFMANQEPKDIPKILRVLCKIKGSRKSVAKLFGYQSETPIKNILEGELKADLDKVGSSPYAISEELRGVANIQESLRLTNKGLSSLVKGLKRAFQRPKSGEETSFATVELNKMQRQTKAMCRVVRHSIVARP